MRNEPRVLRRYRPDFTPAETGLDRFVAYDKPAHFVGKVAALAERASPPSRRLATLVVDAADADAVADEPVFHAGELVGSVTSGGFAHFAERSVALAMLPAQLLEEGATFDVEILGERRAATLATRPLFDPRGERMRHG